EPRGGEQSGGRALALDQRVGRQRGAVDDAADLAEAEAGGGQDRGQAVEHGALREVRRGQDLQCVQPAAGGEREIGEGSPDIDAEAGGAAGHRPASPGTGTISKRQRSPPSCAAQLTSRATRWWWRPSDCPTHSSEPTNQPSSG